MAYKRRPNPLSAAYFQGRCDGMYMYGGKLVDCSASGGCRLPGCPALVKN